MRNPTCENAILYIAQGVLITLTALHEAALMVCAEMMEDKKRRTTHRQDSFPFTDRNEIHRDPKICRGRTLRSRRRMYADESYRDIYIQRPVPTML